MSIEDKVSCTIGINCAKEFHDRIRKSPVNKNDHTYGTDTTINVTTALMVLRDLGAEYNVPINIQLDSLYITVIVNFGKGDSRIHRFYLQDMYHYEEKLDDIYRCIKKDIVGIVDNRERAAAYGERR